MSLSPDGSGAAPPRVFAAPGSCRGRRLKLEPADAARLLARGLGPGDRACVLDNSGWEQLVALEALGPEGGEGRILERRLAREPRSKLSLFLGLLHPADFRRILEPATRLGVVAFLPVITDASMLPAPGGLDDDATLWADLVRDAAEASGRGRLPDIGAPILFDHALEQTAHHGTVLMVDPAGEALDSALAERPFSIAVFFPPPAGFAAEERLRARARGIALVAPPGPPRTGGDPVQAILACLEAIYALLEGGTRA